MNAGLLARPTRLWLSPASIIASWAGLLLALLTPPHGTGFTVCWVKASTGLPCIGCGLTRSLSCALRGMPAESWSYHPFGIPLLLLFLLAACFSLAPIGTRLRIQSWITQHSAAASAVFVLFFGSFMTFGIARWLVEFCSGGFLLR
jgi:hypothetical protein